MIFAIFGQVKPTQQPLWSISAQWLGRNFQLRSGSPPNGRLSWKRYSLWWWKRLQKFCTLFTQTWSCALAHSRTKPPKDLWLGFFCPTQTAHRRECEGNRHFETVFKAFRSFVRGGILPIPKMWAYTFQPKDVVHLTFITFVWSLCFL